VAVAAVIFVATAAAALAWTPRHHHRHHPASTTSTVATTTSTTSTTSPVASIETSTTEATTTTVKATTTTAATTTTTAASGSGSGSGSGAGGFPDASTTGVPSGVTLKSSGYLIARTDGAVIDGLHVTGGIEVRANNVTIKNTLVTGSGYWGILQSEGFSGLTVTDSEVSGDSGTSMFDVGVRDDGGKMNVLRSDIHGFRHGIDDGLIQDNFVHGERTGFPADHSGAFYASHPTTAQNLVVKHNTLFCELDQTSAIMLGGYHEGAHNALIEDNLLAGGDYALYGGTSPENSSTSNIRIIGNVFSKRFFPKSGVFGPVTNFDSNGPGNRWSGNVWEGTNQAVDPA